MTTGGRRLRDITQKQAEAMKQRAIEMFTKRGQEAMVKRIEEMTPNDYVKTFGYYVRR